jgi:ArsR family transcriptional regulator, zinc-responsive transcriptional repressor
MNQSMFEIQADFCKSMGNATRLQIVHILREHPMTVGEICLVTDLPESNVSRHLRALHAIGALNSKRHGNEIIYEIADIKIAEVCDLVRNILVEQIHKRSQSLE